MFDVNRGIGELPRWLFSQQAQVVKPRERDLWGGGAGGSLGNWGGSLTREMLTTPSLMNTPGAAMAKPTAVLCMATVLGLSLQYGLRRLSVLEKLSCGQAQMTRVTVRYGGYGPIGTDDSCIPGLNLVVTMHHPFTPQVSLRVVQTVLGSWGPQ